MKPLFAIFCFALTAIFLLLPATPGRAQSGILLKTFDIKVGKLLLDPNRPRLYATLPLDNSLAIIDTNTNTVLTSFFIGSSPVDLTMSPDGTRLYVANSGSKFAAVGVVDLTTLKTLPSLSAPFLPAAIAAGLDNRLYLLTSTSNSANGYALLSLAQLDATTGMVQATFGSSSFVGGYLAITPDHKTLFYGDGGNLPSHLAAFDVSTSTPGPQQDAAVGSTGSNGQGLTLSHNGKFLIYPNGSGNDSMLDSYPNDTGRLFDFYTTELFSTADINASFGLFDTGAYPGLAVFSADDSLLYQTQSNGGPNGQNAFRIFNTANFAQADAFLDPNPSFSGAYPLTVTGLAITEPHRYLYVAETDGTFENKTGHLELLSTRRAPFFEGSVTLSGGFYYLSLRNGVPFGYYNFDSSPYLFHSDLGFVFPFDAADGQGGIYLYDFKSKTFWFTSRSLFPYLYDFSLNTFLYYYPDPAHADHYNTNGIRYFYNFATGKIIRK